MSEHTYWDELTAGYALDALEPDETAELTAHLRSCAHCREELGAHALVAAQLASVVGEEEAPSWSSIRPQIGAPPTLLAERRRRRPPAQVWLAAAAGLALVVGGTAVLTQRGTQQSPQQVALAACAQDAACHVVHLQDRATLLVDGDAVKVLPTRLAPAPSGHVYVLWQLPRDGRPTMVATLTRTANGQIGERHRLSLAYAETAAFGLSVEPAGVVPRAPSDVVAVGTA